MQTTASFRKFTAGCLALFSTVAVSNAQLTLHLRGSTGVTTTGGDGTAVTAWDDAGTSNSDLTGGGATAPIWNNQPVNGTVSGYITFDGTDDLLLRDDVTGSDLFDSQEVAMFMVIRPAVNTADSILSWWQDGSGSFLQASENDPPGIQLWHGSENFGVAQPGSNFENTWLILTMVRDGTAGDIRVGGQSIGSNPTAFAGTAGLGLGTLQVGQTVAIPGQSWAGDIAEIRVYKDVQAISISGIENELGGTYNLAPVPEPSQYATVFALACVIGAIAVRVRRQRAA